MEEESRVGSPAVSPPPCPSTVTVRRNPPRRARPTPKSGLPSSLKPGRPDVSSFPIQDILDIDLPPKPDSTPIGNPIGDSAPQNLRVYLRIRPVSISPDPIKCDAAPKYRGKIRGARSPMKRPAPAKKKSCGICVTATSGSSVTLSPPEDLQEAKRIRAEVFAGFSHVFRGDSTQNEVYGNMMKPLVEDFLRGTSGMLATLGPSGSGKTHTVFGSPVDPGIVPRALQQILGQRNGDTGNVQRSFYLSMFQIHSEGRGEKVFDLSNGAELCMQQSTIKGLEEVVIADIKHAESLIASGMLRRATAMTRSNSQSSRSQCIINIRNEVAGDDLTSANLTFVDLAGAEREKKTGNQGERLLESNFINNTSMVFSLCLRSLLEHQKNPKRPLQKHFQSSLLTRYLRDYLEGKKRMALLLTVKPGGEDYLDSSYLLRQAAPFMKIKFNNVEEPPAVVCNKRQITALPKTERAKRAKVRKTDASVTEEAKSITAKAGEENKNDNVLLHFTRAMWNVLNQYKKKLKAAESESENLRENLVNEKTRSSDLEKELKILKSSCNCINMNPREALSAQTDANSELDGCTSPKAKEPSSSKSSDEVEGKVQPCVLQAECNNMQNDCNSTFRQSDDEKDAVIVDPDPLYPGDHLDPDNHVDDHVSPVQTKLVPSDSPAVVRENVTSTEASTPVKEPETEPDLDSLCKLSSLDEPRRSSPRSLDKVSDEKDRQVFSQPSHIGYHQCVRIQDELSSGNKDSEGDFEDFTLDKSHNRENLKDTASSSQRPPLQRKDSCSTVELDDRASDDDQEVSSDLPAVTTSKAAESSKVSSPGNEPETASEADSSCQRTGSNKPRRRLLPASSVLLRNMSYWDINDETRQPKGNRGGKNKDAREESRRTKGSSRLLRLLESNLHL